MEDPMQTREIIANMIGILTVQAIKREPITYGDLFKALRLETNRPVGQVVGEYLDYVTVYCITAKIPFLSVMAVNQKGEVGEGFNKWSIDAETARSEVFSYNWRTNPPPAFLSQ